MMWLRTPAQEPSVAHKYIYRARWLPRDKFHVANGRCDQEDVLRGVNLVECPPDHISAERVARKPQRFDAMSKSQPFNSSHYVFGFGVASRVAPCAGADATKIELQNAHTALDEYLGTDIEYGINHTAPVLWVWVAQHGEAAVSVRCRDDLAFEGA